MGQGSFTHNCEGHGFRTKKKRVLKRVMLGLFTQNFEKHGFRINKTKQKGCVCVGGGVLKEDGAW